MSKILVTGSVAYDLLLNYDGSFVEGIDANALEKLSLAFVTPHFERHHGGTGANIAWNLRLLGADPFLVSSVGKDGASYLQLLEERGINIGHIEQLEDHMTATAILATDDEERHIIFFHPGADAAGAFPDLSDDRDDFSYAIVAPRDTTLMTEALTWCDSYKVPVIFDPGQQIMSFGDDALERNIEKSNALIANAYEWSMMADRLNTTPEDLVSELDFVVITRGDEGLSIYTKAQVIDIAACTADRVINPTGAGDALRAGFLAGLNAGWSMLDAGRLGAAMGSFAVEQRGTLMNSLDTDEVWQRAQQAYGEELPSLDA